MKTLSHQKTFKGYCTHNIFGEYKISVPAQNIIYRDYATRNKFTLHLGTNELYFENCYLKLISLVEESNEYDGILMCSFHMLPASKGLRDYLYKKLALNKCELHFVLDNWKVKSENEFTELETIIEINKIIKEKNYQKEIKQVYENFGNWC